MFLKKYLFLLILLNSIIFADNLSKEAMSDFTTATMYENGWGVEKNKGIAFKNYKLSCEKGNYNGCNSVARYYLEGKFVKKDTMLAKSYYEKACDNGNSPSCQELGYLYAEGKIVKQNSIIAIEFFKKACEDGLQESCLNVGRYYVMNNDFNNAKHYLYEGCKPHKVLKVRSVESCYYLGNEYLRNANTQEDIKNAKYYLNIACNLKHKVSCQILSNVNAAQKIHRK